MHFGAPLKNRLFAFGLLATLAMAGYLRFEGLGEPSLWLDEILHVNSAQLAAEQGWNAWLHPETVDRENGPLYYASQVSSQHLFANEFGVRLVPALMGLATVTLLFFITLSATANKTAALVSSLLMAVSPLHVYYSREGRPYAGVMLVATLALFFALHEKRAWSRVAMYVLCLTTAFWAAVAVPVLLSCAVLASVAWLITRRYGHFAIAAGLGLAAALILFPEVEQLRESTSTVGEFAAQFHITSPLTFTALDRLFASLSVSGVDEGSCNWFSVFFFLLALWGGVCLLKLAPRKALWICGLFVLPIAISMAMLVVWDHWYNVRYTSAGLPAFLVLVGIGLVDLWQKLGGITGVSAQTAVGTKTEHRAGPTNSLEPRQIVLGVLFCILLAVLLTPNWRAARLEPNQKPDWRGLTQTIGSLAVANEPIITRGDWAFTCLEYYIDQLGLPIDLLNANNELARATALAQTHKHAWLVSGGFQKTTEFHAWMHTLDPVLRLRRGDLQLYYSPTFTAFLTKPERQSNLLQLLTEESGEGPTEATHQEFNASDLLLGAGWSYPERTPEGMTFRWAKGGNAEIALLPPPTPQPGSEPKAQQLHLRVMPFPSPNQPPQTLQVLTNDHLIIQATLEPGWSEITIPWDSREDAQQQTQPAEETLSETTELQVVKFVFGWSQSPKGLDPQSGDARRLAVAFDYAVVRGGQ